MRNFFIIGIIAILLTACATPVATSQPTAMFIPTTQTPAPTITPTPTNTPVPLTPTATAEKTIEVIYGNQSCQGMITEEGYIEINTGKSLWFDKGNIHLKEGGYYSSQVGNSYLTEYQIITCSDGIDSTDLIYFTMRYFREGISPIDVRYAGLKKLLDFNNGFPGARGLGKLFWTAWLMPYGQDFSDSTKRKLIEAQNLTEFEASLVFPEGVSWIAPDDAIVEMAESEGELDYRFRLIISGVLPD